MADQVYDAIVRRFLEEEGGVIVYLSDDGVFTRALRNIVSRVIGFKGEVLFPYATPGPALEKCLELRDNEIPCVIFVERMLENRTTTDFIINLKREFPGVHIILLTWEATHEAVAYLFEVGVNRFLLKPASANKVIQELAITISPPGDLKKQMNRCEDFLKNEDFDEALEVTDRILLLKPDSARGLTMRGDALMGIGETDKAVQSYMAAHEAKPIFMAPLAKLAEAFKSMEDERALSYMKMLDEISPLNPERKIEIAEQHLLRNETEEAEAYLDKGVEAAERETMSMVGDLTERIVDAVSSVVPKLAVKYLHRVIDNKRVLGRDDLIHFNRLGIILRGEGKWSEAVEIYEKALTIVPDDPVVHYNMGLAYWEGNERTKGLRCFEHALEIDPHFYAGSVGAALNIGSLYLDLRQYQDAEPFFEHVLDLDPENYTAKKRLRDAQDRVPPKHTRKSGGGDRAGSGSSYDVDATTSYNMDAAPAKTQKKPRQSSGASFDVDKMGGGASAKPERPKQSSGAAFNVDEMGGGSGAKDARPKKSSGKSINVDAAGGSAALKKSAPKKSSGKALDVDALFDEPAKPKKKKSSGKVTKLDF